LAAGPSEQVFSHQAAHRLAVNECITDILASNSIFQIPFRSDVLWFLSFFIVSLKKMHSVLSGQQGFFAPISPRRARRAIEAGPRYASYMLPNRRFWETP